MVGIGGLNKKKIDRTHCGICWKKFEENESKTHFSNESFYRCERCVKLREKERGDNR